MKKILSTITALALALCLLTAPAMAANTVTSDGNFIYITDIDSDWTWSTLLPNYANGAPVISIQFNPGAADDVAVFLAGAAGEAAVFATGKCTDEYDARIKMFDGIPVKIFFDFGESTITAGASITITLRLPVADQF
ncbi:MAG: hypothetical protein JRE58_02415 [Deltaproteobacteria bacterium]|nr:hypothetical protein [Deltaproteobacteria bacterium]